MLTGTSEVPEILRTVNLPDGSAKFADRPAYGHVHEPPHPEASLPVMPAFREFIFVKTEQRLERVRLDEILVIEGQRDYRRIHTPARRIMTLQTFAEFERRIPSDIVCRVHKSYMVALGRIDAVERGRIAIQHLTVPISDTYRDRFYTLIGHRIRQL